MPQTQFRRALISVYDKTGIVDFARALHGEFGIEILSTGGTARLLKENDIPVTLVEQVTGFPEMMDGRVKTLHPRIHAAILADRDNPEHMRQLAEQGIEPIDLVVVNLYPFEKTVARPDCSFEQAIEMIDIGGPCLLRAAAKNHKHVLVVPKVSFQRALLVALRDGQHVAERFRSGAAATVFRLTADYDAAIRAWLGRRRLEEEAPLFRVKSADQFPDSLSQGFFRFQVARYGENPHQKGAVYEGITCHGRLEAAIPAGHVHSESTPSFNNCYDAHAGLELCKELTRELCAESGLRCCVFIKHTNACGVGLAATPKEAYRQAYLGDPNAAMGGILVTNFPVDDAFADAVMETYQRWGKSAGAGGFFVEVWVAPGFSSSALEIIGIRKKWGANVRLLEVTALNEPPDADQYESRSITGGMLVQNRDLVGLNEGQWKVVTQRGPSESEMSDLRLAWLVCKHTKSNAITVCKDGMLIGNGAGQMSRVMSCRIATWLAKENGHAERLVGAAAASDAFFPFRDGPDILMDAGATAIIQPGGSKRDQDTIDACNQRGVAMIFTGTRHFKH